MKLGILVVYLVSAGNEWVLDKHLKHLSQTQKFMEFNVYAAINRLPSQFHSALRSHDFIKIVDLPASQERESAEHGTYLDMLAAYALSDGCDYISTFDVDSWPLRDNWIEVAHSLLVKCGAVGASVLRTENGDTVLPHPSFGFFESKIFRDPQCRYWIPENERSNEFNSFLLRHKQPHDTGAAIGFFLDRLGMKWTKLTRTNLVNYHYLMGGLYGEFIFHLGASSRTDMLFRKDGGTWATHVTQPMASIPILWKYKLAAQAFLTSCYQPPVCRRNQRAFDAIAKRLKTDEDGFYSELRGQTAMLSSAA
jgi:hypothetical protein